MHIDTVFYSKALHTTQRLSYLLSEKQASTESRLGCHSLVKTNFPRPNHYRTAQNALLKPLLLQPNDESKKCSLCCLNDSSERAGTFPIVSSVQCSFYKVLSGSEYYLEGDTRYDVGRARLPRNHIFTHNPTLLSQ